MIKALLIFHIISFIVLLIACFLIFNQSYLSNWKHLILNGGLCICYSLGYLLEVCSSGVAEARICLALEYLGLAFLPAVFFFFVCDFCNFKLHKSVYVLLTCFGCFIETLVIFCTRTKLYYTYVYYAIGRMVNHLELGHGIFYYVYIAEEFTLFIFSAVLIWRKRTIETNSIKKRLLTFMFVISLLPMLAVGINLSGVFHEYDVGPLSCTIMLAAMIILMMNSHMTDVVSVSLTNLYYNQGNGIIILDADGRFLNCNYVASNIFPELQTCRTGADMQNIGIPSCDTNEEQFFQKDGNYYSGTTSRIFTKGAHVGYIISIVDVTQMHQQVEEMSTLKAAADAANEAKSKFLATMSHEIRTPLNAIIGMSTLSEMEQNPEIIKQNNHQIKSAGEMLLDIVNEVLDISKAESGKLEIIPVDYDLTELLEGVINISNMRIGDKPIKLIADINPSIPKNLIGDNIRIRQILLNFLSNAEKYTDNGTITFKLDYEEQEDGLILKGSVSDTGRGIKESDIGMLFKPFTQVDTQKNHLILGTGLGLSIVARLLDLMNGTYGVTSEYGKGSEFFFTIPQKKKDDEKLIPCGDNRPIEVAKYASFIFEREKSASESAENTEDKNRKSGVRGLGNEKSDRKQSKEKSTDGYSFPDAKILIVDDNKVNLTVLASFLKLFKIAADKCTSGQEAIDRFTDNEYDLVFMDHMMPEMDGIEAAKIIRSLDNENAKNVTIVACTANVMKNAKEDFADAGMNDFLSKPIIFDQLKALLIKHLG